MAAILFPFKFLAKFPFRLNMESVLFIDMQMKESISGLTLFVRAKS